MSSGDDDPWQMNRNLVECNRYMLGNNIKCDTTFLVGESKTEVRAHQYVLMSRSPVFYAMLSGDHFKTEREVRVPDLEPDAFKQMLQYLYCDDVYLTTDSVLPTLYASKKYLVPQLTKKCVDFLEENLNADNVCLIYEQSIFYDETDLVTKCQTYITNRTDDVVRSPAFLDVSHHTLIQILKLHCLSISELNVFRACLNWAAENCKNADLEPTPANQRELLGDALFLIRCPTLSVKDFSNTVAHAGILTAEEKCAVFEYLTGDEGFEPSYQMKFSTVQRQRPQPAVLRRFSLLTKTNVFSLEFNILKIQCDKPVILKGFSVSGSISYDPLTSVQVFIEQDKTVICKDTVSVYDDMSGGILSVKLVKDVSIRPKIWCTVKLTFNFDGDHDQGVCRRGKSGAKKVSCEGVEFDFDNSDSAGLIHEILFYRT